MKKNHNPYEIRKVIFSTAFYLLPALMTALLLNTGTIKSASVEDAFLITASSVVVMAGVGILASLVENGGEFLSITIFLSIHIIVGELGMTLIWFVVSCFNINHINLILLGGLFLLTIVARLISRKLT